MKNASYIANALLAASVIIQALAYYNLRSNFDNLSRINDRMAQVHDQQLVSCYLGGYVWGKIQATGQPIPDAVATARDSMRSNCKVN